MMPLDKWPAVNRPSSWGRCQIRQSSEMPADKHYFEAATAHQSAAVQTMLQTPFG